MPQELGRTMGMAPSGAPQPLGGSGAEEGDNEVALTSGDEGWRWQELEAMGMAGSGAPPPQGRFGVEEQGEEVDLVREADSGWRSPSRAWGKIGVYFVFSSRDIRRWECMKV